MDLLAENTPLPMGWQSCRLPDFTRIVMGQSPPSTTYNRNGDGLPFFQGKAEFGPLYPTVAKYCSQPRKTATEGATLLSVRAPVGPANLADCDCCIGRGLAAIHPADNIDPKFILHLMRSIEPAIAGKGTGSTFKAIGKDFLHDLSFRIPPLKEQGRIVSRIEELFSELDKGIENLTTAREQLKVYRQAVLKHAFEGKLTVQWREENKDERETTEEVLARIKEQRVGHYEQQLSEWKAAVKKWEKSGKKGPKPQKPAVFKPPTPLRADELSRLPTMPESWQALRLCEVAAIGSGMSVSKARKLADPVEVPYLRVANVQRGYL